MRKPEGKSEQALPGVQEVPDKGTIPNPDAIPRGARESVMRFNVRPNKGGQKTPIMPAQVGSLDHNAGAPSSPSRASWGRAPYGPKE